MQHEVRKDFLFKDFRKKAKKKLTTVGLEPTRDYSHQETSIRSDDQILEC